MRTLRVLVFSVSIVLLPALVGCQTSGGAVTDSKQVQADRATLAKLVGAWDFEGWNEPSAGARRTSKGRAAGVIEHTHFLLLDIESTVAEAGTNRKLEGSILFSVEPKAGLRATTWSDNAPTVRQFSGEIQGGGSSLVFRNIRAVGHKDRLEMTIAFASADRWSATFSDRGTIVASYSFVRAR